MMQNESEIYQLINKYKDNQTVRAVHQELPARSESLVILDTRYVWFVTGELALFAVNENDGTSTILNHLHGSGRLLILGDLLRNCGNMQRGAAIDTEVLVTVRTFSENVALRGFYYFDILTTPALNMLWLQLLVLAQERITDLEAQIVELQKFNLSCRFAKLMLERKDSSDQLLGYTHADYAYLLGAQRVNLTQIISSFAAAGYIEVQRKSIKILDLQAVAAVASGSLKIKNKRKILQSHS